MAQIFLPQQEPPLQPRAPESLMSRRSTAPVTVEAEYSTPGNDEGITQTWTFYDWTPEDARDAVISDYVPLDATLWRVGVWYGEADDRPDGGHKNGIFD